MTSTDTTPGSLGPEALGIQAAALDGDPGLAYRLVAGLMAEGVSFDRVLFDVLAPVQRDVGARWLRADYEIADEHAASAAVETVVALLTGIFEMPAEGPQVVVACAEGETHSLPARMVAAYLTYLEWRVTFLGATLPADALGTFLARTKPDALLLSCSQVGNLLGARAAIRAAHEAGVPVIAGGNAFRSGDRALALGADAWVSDPRELDELLESWAPDPTAAETRARQDDEAVRLAASLPAVIEAAMAGEDAGAESLRDDLRLVGAALTSAVLLDDRTALDEILEGYRIRRAAGDDVPAEEQLIGLLAAGLPDSPARSMLTGGD